MHEHIYVLCVCVCKCAYICQHVHESVWLCMQVWVHMCVYMYVCIHVCVCVPTCTCTPRSQRYSTSQSRYIHSIWDTDLKMYRTENVQLEKETAKNEPEMFFLPFSYSQGSYTERKEELQ